jgi:hypothetical protein
MTDEQQETYRQLSDDVDGLMEEVENALDPLTSFGDKLKTRIKVEEAAQRYKDLTGVLGEKDKMQVERLLGRKLVDVRKMAGPLPTPPAGKPAEKKAQNEFFEARPISASSSRQPKTLGGANRNAARYSVGGEVESWCSRCDGMHTHTILAVAGDEPAQVQCHVCRSPHKYRATRPLPRGVTPTASRATTAYKPTTQEREAQARADEKKKLVDELQRAENVRKYEPKERYKPGEVLEHAEWGRGKIENILQRSMLVRFPAGLKTLKLG